MDSSAPLMAEPVAAPEDNREYQVVLGRSLLEDVDDGGETGAESEDASKSPAEPREVFTTFRYEFQPASVDKAAPSLVSVDESRGVQVLMASSTGAPGGVLFKGKLAENKDTDCLLIFDGTSFRLERCPFACTQLRHVRAPTTKKPGRASLGEVALPKEEDGALTSPSVPSTALHHRAGAVKGVRGRRPSKLKTGASSKKVRGSTTSSREIGAIAADSTSFAALSVRQTTQLPPPSPSRTTHGLEEQ